MYSTLLLECRDAIATITLNRPDKRNAGTTAMIAYLQTALDAIEKNHTTRVVILTGAGKAFCAGMDLEMLAAIANGDSKIHNYSTGADCHSTLACVRALGIAVDESGNEIVIHGQGADGLRAPSSDLDAGNSGSTIRMLSGILAAQTFDSRIGGDESLSRRPMARIIKPLEQMGAHIEGACPQSVSISRFLATLR